MIAFNIIRNAESNQVRFNYEENKCTLFITSESYLKRGLLEVKKIISAMEKL